MRSSFRCTSVTASSWSARVLTPKLRVTLNSELFVQFVGKVFEAPKDLLILCAMGVIRERDQAVDFW